MRTSQTAVSLTTRLILLIASAAAIGIVAQMNGFFTDADKPALPPGPTAHTAQVGLVSAVASAEVPEAHAAHLVDGDEATTWRAPWSHGDHLEVRLTTERHVVITGLEIISPGNGTGTVGQYEVHIDGGTVLRGEIDLGALRYWVAVPKTLTREVVIHVTGVALPDGTATDVELEVADIRLYSESA